MKMELSANIFRAYDIRGKAEKDLCDTNLEQIARGFASIALTQNIENIYIACDARLSSPRIINTLIMNLANAGLNVINLGVVPTPVLYYACTTLNYTSGIMVTGSHNPKDDNGLKIMLDGKVMTSSAIKEIYNRITTQRFDLKVTPGTVTRLEIGSKYRQDICERFRFPQKIKVVIDAGNGVAGELAPQVLRALGAEVIELYCDLDGNFPNHHPDPANPKNLADLQDRVISEQADIGLAFDGDGDRLGVIDNHGEIIVADRLIMLFAADVLQHVPGAKIIYDVKCSQNLDKFIMERGGDPLMWKTGHSLIKSKMLETGAPFAGEMSGHIFFRHNWYGFDDAIYSAARLIDILSRYPDSANYLFKTIPNSVNTPEIQIPVAAQDKFAIVERLQEIAPSLFSGKISTIDGLRIDFSNGFALVRSSNTTDCLVLRFEADSNQELAKIKVRFKQLLEEVLPEPQTIPF